MIHISIIIFKEHLFYFLKQNKTCSQSNGYYHSIIVLRMVFSTLHMQYSIIILDLYNNKNNEEVKLKVV
jgi:hypothetical protein